VNVGVCGCMCIVSLGDLMCCFQSSTIYSKRRTCVQLLACMYVSLGLTRTVQIYTVYDCVFGDFPAKIPFIH